MRAAPPANGAAPAASGGPTLDEIAAAENMPAEQRTAMIQRHLVAKLSDRLHANGNDVDGWLRLVRAYFVLGEREKAKGAAADAKRALADHPESKSNRSTTLLRACGLEG